MNVLGIIPARGGSKSIPRKNLALLAGRPLVDYTIDAARDAEVVTRFLVSTDDGEIGIHCRELGVEVVNRPDSLATDTVPTESVIAHVLEYLRDREKYQPDWAVLLQPTSPLRTAADIDRAYALMLEQDASGALSVYEPPGNPYKALTVDDAGRLKGLVDDRAPFTRRQDRPLVYYPNGAIYIFRADEFLRGRQIPLRGALPYVMPESLSIDIDMSEDLARAETILAVQDG